MYACVYVYIRLCVPECVYAIYVCIYTTYIYIRRRLFISLSGMLFGLAYTTLTCFITKGREPWTFKNRVADSEKTEPAAKHREIDYPKSDGVLSFDLLTNLQRSGETGLRYRTYVCMYESARSFKCMYV